MKKEQFHVEYVFNKVSVRCLWNQLTTSQGLSAWFADEINIIDNVYTFVWNKEQQSAKVLSLKPEQLIRFRWEDDEPDCYVEFKIQSNELTGSTLLTITDFSEKGELQDAINMWNIQIGDLQRSLGI